MKISRALCVFSLSLLATACKFEKEPAEADPSDVDRGPVPFAVQEALLPANEDFVLADGQVVRVGSARLLAATGIVVLSPRVFSDPTTGCRLIGTLPGAELDGWLARLRGLHLCERQGAIPACLGFIPPGETPSLVGEGQKIEFVANGLCGAIHFCDEAAFDGFVIGLMNTLKTRGALYCDSEVSASSQGFETPRIR